jgi:hypothetical protein
MEPSTGKSMMQRESMSIATNPPNVVIGLFEDYAIH